MFDNALHTRGFIALMSAVIISAVLLLMVVTGGLTGFYARANIFDAELKSRSAAAADACLDHARLLVANNPAYMGSDTQTFNSLDTCSLTVSAGASPAERKFEVQGVSGEAHTNLEAAYDTATHSLTDLAEVP